MPGMYSSGEYDLAGFAVGVVEKDAIIDGADIAPGDAVLGLASSGPHSNGFSLIRRILERTHADLAADFHGRSLGDALLAPTRIYVKPLLALMRTLKVKGLAHITGGGLLENVPRILPETAVAELDRNAWPRPPLFSWLQEAGAVADQEMFRVFNCGIGMAVVVAEADAQRALDALNAAGETAYRIGRIRKRAGDEPQTRMA
jgi:phosphoribosylformylglycinamidine cyclo-ligase